MIRTFSIMDGLAIIMLVLCLRFVEMEASRSAATMSLVQSMTVLLLGWEKYTTNLKKCITKQGDGAPLIPLCMHQPSISN